ncbi:MAG: hypothetical protein J2P18_05355 [Nocardia sp.]|nr:hypothetical protein [Nocardia sp.]
MEGASAEVVNPVRRNIFCNSEYRMIGRSVMSTYQRLDPIERDAALIMISSGISDSVCEAILRIALHDPDPDWATDQALALLTSPAPEIRGVSATALGHIARLHRHTDKTRVVPALQKLLSDPENTGRAEDALDDIAMFAGRNKESHRLR